MNAIHYALAEFEIIRQQILGTDPEACERLVDAMQAAKRIFVGGAGRSLLSMKMLAMRLMQTDHETYLVGEVCTPSIGKGDLLVVSSGRGETKSTLELIRKAKANGARAAVLTMHPEGSVASEADLVLTVPAARAATADDSAESAFMKKNLWGDFFETASLVVMDGLIARIMAREGMTWETIMKNHANLE